MSCVLNNYTPQMKGRKFVFIVEETFSILGRWCSVIEFSGVMSFVMFFSTDHKMWLMTFKCLGVQSYEEPVWRHCSIWGKVVRTSTIQGGRKLCFHPLSIFVCGRIQMKFCGQVGCVTRKNWFNFGEDPDPIIFSVILHNWEMGPKTII